MVNYQIRELHPDDFGYALTTWRESHKPATRGVPWSVYKYMYGAEFEKILRDRGTLALAAYAPDNAVLGYLVASPGKSVDTLHWTHTRRLHGAGAYCRRQKVMTELIRAASFGDRYIYTLRARKKLDKKLAEYTLAAGLGQAIYVPLKEWLK